MDVTITRNTTTKVTHCDVTNTNIKEGVYIVETPYVRYKYPLQNIFEIKEDSSTKSKAREKVLKDKDVVMI